eukprot:jgi/Ulvmu1/8917/UM005_0008.1
MVSRAYNFVPRKKSVYGGLWRKMTLAKFFTPMPNPRKRERADESCHCPSEQSSKSAVGTPNPSLHEAPAPKTAKPVVTTKSGLQTAVCTLQPLITDPSWGDLALSEAQKQYWKKLETFMRSQWATATVYPPQQHIFRALNSVPLAAVRVVIIGQDPYHGAGQAEGWSFSVPKGQKIPSSLQNIYKELHQDLGCTIPRHGHLEAWVKQGVLLLNTSLTVEANKANSHSKKGWETFTDTVITHLSKKRKGLVFLLWGKHAQARKKCIDCSRHTVLESAHPSGLSAHRGFFGCSHFSKANVALKANGVPEIDWQISS